MIETKQTEFNKVKATFDKVNELLGKEDNATSDELTLVYQELVQAIELARTLPQRSIDSNTLKRSTRGVNSDRAARGSVSYQNAYTEYYVSSDDDGSGYPPGTFYMLQIKVHHIIYLQHHIICCMLQTLETLPLLKRLKTAINGTYYLTLDTLTMKI